jgi:hypothetical protein
MDEIYLTCPYCAQEVSMLVDPTDGTHEYVEDCEVCCNPISVKLKVEDREIISFETESLEQ